MSATLSFDHSAIYRGLLLRLVIANDLSLVIGFKRIDQKVILMQLAHQFNSYNLMHNQKSSIRYKDKLSSSTVVRCTRACLDPKAMLVFLHLLHVDHRTPFALACLNFRLRFRVIYPYMHKYEPRLKCAMHEVQRHYWCKTISNLVIMTHKSCFIILHTSFSID
jgi:hypothetical protein